MIKVSVPELYHYVAAILEKAGVPDDETAIIADMLVQADQRGVHSHGIVCVPRYVRLMKNGFMRTAMEYRVEREKGAVEVWDGMRSSGQVLGYYAMKRAMEKAAAYGIGVTAVRHANHFGAGAYYAQMAQREGMIGIALSTGDPTMAPWGGADKAIGNNPIAIAVPAGGEAAPVLDMAQSVVANGKITNMKRQGLKEIPAGWALDKDGVPTTRIEDFYSVMPTGGYKGFGASLMVDILSGILFGGGTGFQAADQAEGPAMLMMAWDIGAFRDKEEFLQDVDGRIRELKSVRKAKDSDGILVPGEPEAIRYRQSAQYTEVIPENLDMVEELAEEMGLPRFKREAEA